MRAFSCSFAAVALSRVAAVVVVACAAGCSTERAPALPAPDGAAPAAAPPGGLLFEENTGRYPAAVRYVARRGDHVVFVDDAGFAVDGDGARVSFSFGAAAVRGDQPQPTVVRHYARDRAWVARSYGSVVFAVADGVEVVVYGNADGALEYDWRFARGVRREASVVVEGAVDGAVDGAVEAGGDLVVGPVRVSAPRSFLVDAAGRASPVASALRWQPASAGGGGLLVVDVAGDDVTQALVVDPVVAFQGSVGGSRAEMRGEPFRFDAPGVGVDNDGNVYLSGTSHSPDLPTNERSLQRENLSGADAFVGSVSGDGRTLRWITYIATGGESGDELRPLAVDRKDDTVVLAVRTRGAGFPTTERAFQRDPAGDIDVGLVKLDRDGALVAGTFFGSNGGDFPYALTVDDDDGAVVVGGFTNGKFAVPAGALRVEPQGLDGFVGVLSADLSGLLGATHVGGAGTDLVLGLRSKGGFVSVSGQADGADFMGVPDERPQGVDAFVLQMRRSADGLKFAHLLGGPGLERGFGVDVGADGSVYLAGLTDDGRNFPVDAGFESGSGGLDGFVAHYDADGRLVRSTLLAGGGDDFLGALAVLEDGRVVVGGSVRGTDGFVERNGCATDGGEEGVIALLKPDLEPEVLALLDLPVRNLAVFGGDRVVVAGEDSDTVISEGAVRGGGEGDVAFALLALDSVSDGLDCLGGATDPGAGRDEDGDFVTTPTDADDRDGCVPDVRASVCGDDDGDGLGRFEEDVMTRTNNGSADSDGDGVADRREAYASALFALKCAAGGNFELATPCAVSLVDRGGFVDLAVVTLDGAAIAVDGLALDRQRRLFAFQHVGAQSRLVEIDRPTARARVAGDFFDGSVTGAGFLGGGVGFSRGDDIVTGVARDPATGGLSLLDVDVDSGVVRGAVEVIGVPPQLFVSAPFDVALDRHGAAWLLTGDNQSQAVVGVVDVDSGVVNLERPFRYDNGSGGPLGLAFDVDEVGVVVALDANGTEDVDRLDLCSGARVNIVSNIFAGFNAGNADLAQAPPDALLLDDDGDGVPTALELEGAFACNDADGDGRVDAEDSDADDDGRADGVEDANRNGVVDAGESDPRNRCDPDLTQPGCGLADDDGDCIVDAVAGRRVDVGAALYLASGGDIFAFDPRDPAAGPQLSCSSDDTSGLAVDAVGGLLYAAADASPVVFAHDAASLARRPAFDLDTGAAGGAIAVDATGRVLYRLTGTSLVALSLDDARRGALLASYPLPGPRAPSGSLGIADGHALAVDAARGVLYVADNEDPSSPSLLQLPLISAFRLPPADALVDTDVAIGFTGGVGAAFGQAVLQSVDDATAAVHLEPGSATAPGSFQSRLTPRAFSATNLSISAFQNVDGDVVIVEADGATGEVWLSDFPNGTTTTAPRLLAGASGRGVFAIGHVDGDASRIDRDTDGATDLAELGAGTDPDDADSDDDGVLDGRDPDSGDVCVPDLASSACDADGDGVFGEAVFDSDQDGLDDPLDDDDDDDGVPTSDEVVTDGDGDGVPGYLDPSERGGVICGDGVADCVFEACDDGNSVDGDGCDALCARDGAIAFRLTGDDSLPACQRFTPNGVPGAGDSLVLDASSPDFAAANLSLGALTLAADYAGTARITALQLTSSLAQAGGALDVDALFVTGGDAGARISVSSAVSSVIDDVALAPGDGGIGIDGALVVGGDLTLDEGVVDGAVVFAAAGSHDIRGVDDDGSRGATLGRLVVRERATVRPQAALAIGAIDVEGGVLVLPRDTDPDVDGLAVDFVVVVDDVVVSDGVFAPSPLSSLRALEVRGGVVVGSDDLAVRERFIVEDAGRFFAGRVTRIGGDGATVFDTGAVRFNDLVIDGDEVVFSSRSDLRVQGTLTASGLLRGADVAGAFGVGAFGVGVGGASRGQWSVLAQSAVFGPIAVRDSLNLDVEPLLPADFTDLGNNTRWGPQANPPRCGALSGVFGPVVLVDDAAVSAFNDAGVQCVDGDLEIGADVTTVELENLIVITGTLRVRNSGASSVVLPVLTDAGAVDVSDNDALAVLELPALENVDDSFVVEDNDALEQLLLPAVESVGGDLVVDGNDALTDVDAPSLENIGGDLVVSDNDALDGLGLAVLVDVGGDLQLVGNPDLIALLLPLLEDIGGTFTIVDNDALTTVTAPALEHVGGDLVISGNDDIDAVSVPPTLGVGGELAIEDDVVVADCGDGVVEAGEACDDGGNVDGDGCDGGCAVDEGFVCAGAPSVCARDRDGDGTADLVDVCADVADDQADGDADRVGDACDADDGNGGGAVGSDADPDGDGVDNDVDNCADVANNDQADLDGDGDGDACDDDADGDGADNDPCPLLADVDDCAADEDGDGLDDADDPCPVTAGDAADADGDGIGDACDADDDGDTVVDDDDNCAAVDNAAQDDADDDGRGDACDLCVDVAGPRDGCPVDAPPPPPPDDGNQAPEGCAQSPSTAPLALAAGLLLLLRRRRPVTRGVVRVGGVVGVVVSVALAPAAQAATFTGAVSANVSVGANWDTGAVPVDVAIFAAGAPAALLDVDLRVDSVVVAGDVSDGDGGAFVFATDVVVDAGGRLDAPLIAGPAAAVQVAAGGFARHIDLPFAALGTLVNDGVIDLVAVSQPDGAAAVVGSGSVGLLQADGVVLWSMDDAALDAIDNRGGLLVFDGHDVVTAGLRNTGVISGAASLTVDGSGAVVLGALTDAPALALLPRDAGLDVAAVDVALSSLTVTGSSELRFVVDGALGGGARLRVSDALLLRGAPGAPLTVRGPVSLEIPADSDDVEVDHVALQDVTIERGLFIDAANFTDLGGNRGFGPPPGACGGAPAFVGDLLLATDDDVAAFEASAIECVDGDVVFGRDVIDAVLTHLTRVTGRISIRDGLVRQVALTALVDAGAIDIAGNGALTSIDLPVLDDVADDLNVADNDALATLELPSLTGVGGDLAISGNDALEDVSAPVIAAVGGDLVLDGNDSLADVVLTVLAIVNGDVVAIDNDTLVALLLEALAEIGGSVVISGNDALEDVGLDAVATVGGDLTITDNDPDAAAPDLTSLQNVGGDLDIDVEPAFPDGFTCEDDGDCHPICGDARVIGGESCDDGNEEGGDGCSVVCQVEAGFVCDGACRRDGDGDGVIDDNDVCARVADDQRDTDGDGLGDACDDDDDGDGRADVDDDCQDDADADHRDGDCAFVSDVDRDGDGIVDDDDACPDVADVTGACADVDCASAFDCDDDGVDNEDDLCPTVAAEQRDDDGDGLGDDCDSDDDGDGVPDFDDACPAEFDPAQLCGVAAPDDDDDDDDDAGGCAAAGSPPLWCAALLGLLLSRRGRTGRA